MIYIFTALYCEARIFIERFGLQKETERTYFQQFFNETADIRLTVCGTGGIAAAAAVSSVCTQYKPGPEDFLLNVGICAGAKGVEGVFLINKLTQQAAGRTFYPDILYRHAFQEKGIVTGMAPLSGGPDQMPAQAELYDMEAAAVYEAGAYFFGPHQLAFLKIVSDHGDAQAVSDYDTQRLMKQYKGQIFAYVDRLVQIGRTIRWEFSRYRKEQRQEEKLVCRLASDLHCSKAMEDQLRKQIHYLTLTGMDPLDIIQGLYEENRLPCADRRAGKQLLEYLKKVFLEMERS